MTGVSLRVRLAAITLLAGWAISLCLPVAIMGPLADNRFPGWMILTIGWMGIMVLQVGWFANLVIVPGLLGCLFRPMSVSRRKWPRRRIGAAVLTVLAVDALFWRKMYGDDGTAPIEQFGAGYYLWFAVTLGTAALLWFVSRQTPAQVDNR